VAVRYVADGGQGGSGSLFDCPLVVDDADPAERRRRQPGSGAGVLPGAWVKSWDDEA